MFVSVPCKRMLPLALAKSPFRCGRSVETEPCFGFHAIRSIKHDFQEILLRLAAAVLYNLSYLGHILAPSSPAILPSLLCLWCFHLRRRSAGRPLKIRPAPLGHTPRTLPRKIDGGEARLPAPSVEGQSSTSIQRLGIQGHLSLSYFHAQVKGSL